MISSSQILSGSLGIVAALLLGSCGDPDESAQNPTTPEPGATSNPYPLTTCVVSGEKLGSMGKPHVIIHEGTEVRFCCKECVPKFEANPAPYLAKLQAGTSPDDLPKP